MDQQNNGNTGAPSTDTTSALFVSARKKQLEQQEAERQAKEREAERLAAEAEVRRLEQEVAERKRRAQEEAQRVEQEAAQRRLQAQQEEQRAQQEAAQRRAQAQQEEQRAQKEAAAHARTAQTAQPAAQAAPKQGAQKAKFSLPSISLPINKWILIGGGAVVLLAVILIIALGGGNASVSAKNFTGEVSSADGLSVSYPEAWSGDTLANNGTGLYLQGDDGLTVLAVMDMTDGLASAMANGVDAVSAAEGFLYDVAGVFASGSAVTDMEPAVTKSGSSVQGSAGFRYQDGGVDMRGVAKIESIEGARTVLAAYAVPEGKSAEKQGALCEAVLGTLMIGDPGDGGASSGAGESDPYWETDSRFMLYSNEATGLRCYISTELDGKDSVFVEDDMNLTGVSFQDKFVLLDYTAAYQSMAASGGTFENLAEEFIRMMVSASSEGAANIYIGEPVAEASGTRVDFSFDMESGPGICALRVFDAQGVCLVVMGHDVTDAQREYFDVMAASMSPR